jgi:hypothetical protein
MKDRRLALFRKLIALTLLALFFSGAFRTAIVYAQAGEVTLKPTEDTYVEGGAYGHQDSVYGTQDYFKVSNSTGYEAIAWMQFNLSAIPDGAAVDTASLNLRRYDFSGTTNRVCACSCSNNSWTELTLSYSNMPSYNTTVIGWTLVSIGSQGCSFTIDNASVQDAIDQHPKTMTIVLADPSSHIDYSSTAFFSKDSGPVLGNDVAPTLTVHWSSIVPEFSSFVIVPFFVLIALLAAVYQKKKTRKKILRTA